MRQVIIKRRNVLLVVIFIMILIVISLLVGKFTYSYLAPDVDETKQNEGIITAAGDTLIFGKGDALTLTVSDANFNPSSGSLTSVTMPFAKLVANNATNEAIATYNVGFRINRNTYTYSREDKTPELILTIKDNAGNIIDTSSDALNFVTVTDRDGVSFSGFDVTGLIGAFNVLEDYEITTTSSTSGTTQNWTYELVFVNLENDQSINESALMDLEVILQKDYILPLTIAEYIKRLYTTDGQNNLYYHDGNYQAELNDNSYRYSGATPNNYICLDNECSKLYRIIGVFNNYLKIIQVDSIGDYAWNRKDEKVNSWEYATINTDVLNKDYYNSISKYQNLIAEASWDSGEEVKFLNNIGLLSLNDYVYASTPSNWNEQSNLDNWLNDGVSKWLITLNDNTSLIVNEEGSSESAKVTDKYAVYPVFYLKSNIIYQNGDGSIDNPYIIKIPVVNFKVDNKTYEFEDGMTWQTWLDSTYNDENFYLDNDNIVPQDKKDYVINGVISSDIIIKNGNYTLKSLVEEE